LPETRPINYTEDSTYIPVEKSINPKSSRIWKWVGWSMFIIGVIIIVVLVILAATGKLGIRIKSPSSKPL
jgi:hypothetical protein